MGLKDVSTNANLFLDTNVMVNERIDFNQVMTTAQGLESISDEGAGNDYYRPCCHDLHIHRLSDALLRTAVFTRYQTTILGAVPAINLYECKC